MSKKKIGTKDFLRMFGCKPNELPKEFSSRLDRMDTQYRDANADELGEYVLNVLKLINKSNIRRSTKENLEAFERGWQENLKTVISSEISIESLKPKYFRESKFLRYNKGLIVVDNPNLEYDLYSMVRLLIFNKYLASFENIYELGCGSCQNLLILSEMFPSKKLYGLDWTYASAMISEKITKKLNKKIKGIVFDITSPSPDVIMEPDSAIISIHAMEQIGDKHENLLAFILSAKPSIVIHYEPIVEFYEKDNLLDYLAVLYSNKRNYLLGFWTALCELEKQKKIEIIESRRPFLGGVIHESSLIVWRPLMRV